MDCMILADRALALRLEGAEAFACRQFAETRARLFPGCGSQVIRVAGTTVVFDGADAPTTQTFGLGLFEELTADDLDQIEQFFRARGAAVMHEVCPFAGINALTLLCDRGYRPIEISSVLYRLVDVQSAMHSASIRVRVISQNESELWNDVSTRGWCHEHPELESFMRQMGVIAASREQSPCFLAEFDGVPAAAGGLVLHQGVALFAGASTVPDYRRRGLQAALLSERMGFAAASQCDLAMMVAEAGSSSQHNAEREGFRVAYTRTKWQLKK
jgi:GNAT superfamily N-acetyltransferase